MKKISSDKNVILFKDSSLNEIFNNENFNNELFKEERNKVFPTLLFVLTLNVFNFVNSNLGK